MNESDPIESQPANARIQVIGLGELLWDCFPDRKLPGGAPANVAFHAQQLGLSAAVATRVGQDPFGEELTQFLISTGLNTDLVQVDPSHATGTVSISSDSNNVRYTFLENSAWDYLEPRPELLEAIQSAQAICFGTLCQRRPVSRNTIHQCLQSAPKGCHIVYDVNLRPPFFAKDWIIRSLKLATVVKLNIDEVSVLSKLLHFSSSNEIRFAKLLLDNFKQLQLVCITRGDKGCLGVTCDDVLDIPGISVEVGDTVGAGDAFTAGIIFGQLSNWPLAKTFDLANNFGSLVAGRKGAMPILTQELQKLTSTLDWSYRETSKPRY